MLRTKHKNLSIKLCAIASLCLCCGLVMYRSLPAAYAASRPPQPYYVVDSRQNPGVVSKIVNRQPRTYFRRQSGGIANIALYNGHLFFCPPNDRRIYQRVKDQERVVFTHREYIRDIAFDSQGNLYFTEARRGKGDGRIWKLSPPVRGRDSQGRFTIAEGERPIQVRLRTVDGFWEGNLYFDSRGNLYLTSGEKTPAFVYKADAMGSSRYGSPQKKYKDMKSAITGIAIDPRNSNLAYYVDGRQTVYRLDISNLRRSVEFSGSILRSRNPQLSDIAFDISGP